MHKYSGKDIQVSCAIIERNGLVLAAQRSEAMDMPLKWEFPGGKIKLGEDPEVCLRRELMEEMGILLDVTIALSPSTHHYGSFTVTLHPFICTIASGGIALIDHRAIFWLKPDELTNLDWAEADLAVIYAYQKMRCLES